MNDTPSRTDTIEKSPLDKHRGTPGLVEALVAEPVRLWVRQTEKDSGRRPGGTTAELKRLKRENAELRRANDILRAAAQFFGAELDRQSKK